MTGITSNINDLLELLNNPEQILSFNTTIEDDIRFNGGNVLYTYDNIIIASEISESFYKELLKNPDIEYIESLPLKRFSGIDSLNNIDLSIINSGVTTKPDSVSGETNNTILIDLTMSGTTKNTTGKGVPPTIENNIFTLSASTNELFDYNILASGTLPITFQFIKPSNYVGDLYLKNTSHIIGSVSQLGIYNITIKAINAYGSYTKNLILTIADPIRIINTNLIVNNKLGSNFYYSIESSGSLPKTYSMSGNPSGLSLDDNIISGIPLSVGTYNINIGVSGITTSDSKTLVLNVGTSPIITSSGIATGPVNSYFEYNILPSGVNYSISGSLNDGLTFKDNKIDGIPTTVGSRTVTIKAVNAFGQSTKNLTITIYQMGT